MDTRTVETLVTDWPEMAKGAADEITKKYGQPNEAIPSRLIWYSNGPRKRTVIYRHEIPHNSPQPHTDVVEQFIDYHVPPEKVGELAKFDGSVIVERTAGEVSARCDIEAANFLAIDMVHEIVTGKLTTEEARKVYSKSTSAYVTNRPAPYAEAFQVERPRRETADKNEPAIAGAMARQGVEKAKYIGGQDGAATRRG